MERQDGFTSIETDKMTVNDHRREAARLRVLAAAATTETVRLKLTARAREYDRLAGDLLDINPGSHA